MTETLLQKAQRLGIQPTGTPVVSASTETLLQKAQRLGIQPAQAPIVPTEAPEEKSTLSKVGGFLAPTITGAFGKVKRGEELTGRDVVGSVLEAGSYLLPVGAVARGVGLAAKGVGLAVKGLGKRTVEGSAVGALGGGLAGSGRAVGEGEDVAGIAKATAVGLGAGGLIGGAIPGAIQGAGAAFRGAREVIPKVGAFARKAPETILSKGKGFVRSVTDPSVSPATKVSLNPAKALEGTGQDVLVSIKTSATGKPATYSIKNLSKLTPEEKTTVQANTAENLDTFTKQAELFKNSRSVKGGSPAEIVGTRTDEALSVADKQRQSIGAKMGVIEQKYVEQTLPFGVEANKTVSDFITKFAKPKFGVDTGGAPVVQKFTDDYIALVKNGGNIGDRLSFVRDWQRFLKDSTDAFGNFKENASTNMGITKAVNAIRDETVKHITLIDKGYAKLRPQYAEHVKLQKIGDALLGKEGALGEKIKGAATVKRAIQSNSDAGARQFLTKLKQLTGYDAIQEGDIALTAMNNVGDYQGLSLLNVLNDGKGGVTRAIIEKIRDVTVGTDATRVGGFIQPKIKSSIIPTTNIPAKTGATATSIKNNIKATIPKSISDQPPKVKSTPTAFSPKSNFGKKRRNGNQAKDGIEY